MTPPPKMDAEYRDLLLDAIHRRATALARITSPKHTGRSVDAIVALTAGNLMRTLCVALGRAFFDDMLSHFFARNDEAYGLCCFCREAAFIEEKGMCQRCWDENEQIDREHDAEELMEAPTRGQPS